MVCLLCDFKILLTVFNQSYNCQTSYYLGRNRLPKHFLILPSLDQGKQSISHNCWSAPPVDSQEENPLTFKLVNTTSGKLRVALTLKCLPVHLLLQKVGYNDHGGFHVVAKIIRELKSHMIPYKFKCSHWLKLQQSDQRANLVKDFFDT